MDPVVVRAWALQNQTALLIALGVFVVIGIAVIPYRWGLAARERRMRRLVKRNEYGAERFVMQSAEDGAMEIRLTKKAYKELRGQPIQGAIVGNKNQMILRIVVI